MGKNWCLNKMRSLDWKQLVGKMIHGNTCLESVKKESSILNERRSTSFQILYCVLVRYTRTQSNDAPEDRLGWFKTSSKYRNFDRIDGEPMDSEENIFTGFNTLQLSDEVKCLLLRLDDTPENFTGRKFSCGSRDNEKEMHVKCRSRFSKCKEIWKRTNGHSLVLDQRKKWYSIGEDSPQGKWDRVAEQMTITLPESRHPIFRSTSPLSRGVFKSKGC